MLKATQLGDLNHRACGFTLEFKLILTPKPNSPFKPQTGNELPLVRSKTPRRRAGSLPGGILACNFRPSQGSLCREMAEGVSFPAVFRLIHLWATGSSSRTAKEDHEGQEGPLQLSASYIITCS